MREGAFGQRLLHWLSLETLHLIFAEVSHGAALHIKVALGPGMIRE